MRAVFGRISLWSSAALALAAGLAVPVQAQDAGSVSDYRLPEPRASQRPTRQGPVDPDNPFAVPSGTPRPEPTPTPSPAPSAAPRIALPPPTATPTPTRAAPERQPRPAATPSPQASETPAPSPSPTPAPAPPASEPAPDPAPLPSASEPLANVPSDAPVVQPAPEERLGTWTIVGGLAAVAVAGGAVALLRRRRTNAAQAEAPEPAAAPPAPPPPRPVTPAPVPAPAPAPIPPAAMTGEPLALATAFVPQAIRLSLVYATLQYELEIANAGTETLLPLHVRADLASAHASIGTREQLAPAPAQLEAKHAVPALAPGETVTLKGEVRVPLQQVVPVTKGNARFFVPLVRFCFIADDGAAVRRVFTVGPADPGSGAIASVRLDAGPRNLRELAAREIEAARGFTLDPVGAHG